MKVFLLCGLAVLTFGAEQRGPLRAGAAKADITPTSDMFPMRASQTFGGVHDPLYARALILDNGSSKVALISVDTGSITNPDEIVNAVAAELKIPASHLSIASTHDHSTPTAGSNSYKGNFDPAPYRAILKRGIVEAARQANARLQPARLGFGTGKAYINTNRDQKIGAAYGMGYAPEGPSDKTVAVISVTSASGEPIAVWSNYAVHGVVMYLSKTRDGMMEISGDIGGWTSRYVEERLKNDAIAVWTQGASGDQNPLFMSNYNQDAPDVHDEGAAGWALLDVQSRRLGEEIVRVTRAIQNTTDRVLLWGASTVVSCPGRKPEGSAMVDGDPVKIALSLLMINDIALANVGAEVFTEISQHLKQESLFDRTAMVTLSPGKVGYIPTDKAYLLPAAMAVNNRLKPGCAEPAIVNTFVDLEKQYLPLWTAASPR